MVDDQRHLDASQEQFNISSMNLKSGDTAIVLNLRDEDLHEGDVPVARLFVNNRFVKIMSTGTWKGEGGNYGPQTDLGKLLERSLVNQAKSNDEIKALLVLKGYSFEEAEK